MRRWFIVLLTLLVAAQLSWAGAALCCVDELAGSPGEPASLVVGEQAHTAGSDDAHPVCETGHCHCHHAGCATPQDETDVPAAPRTLRPEPIQTLRLKSHIPSGLERPNWQRA